jgi:hypothetical protein
MRVRTSGDPIWLEVVVRIDSFICLVPRPAPNSYRESDKGRVNTIKTPRGNRVARTRTPFPDAGRFRPIFVVVPAAAICGINRSVYAVRKRNECRTFSNARRSSHCFGFRRVRLDCGSNVVTDFGKH